jgi:hypothetical protein
MAAKKEPSFAKNIPKSRIGKNTSDLLNQCNPF